MEDKNYLYNYNEINEFYNDINILQNNRLAIFHLNIRSMRTNFDEFNAFLSKLNFNFDTLILSEIWITDNEQNFYRLNGYKHYINSRIYNRSGGIIIYIKEKLELK